jgi:hypothetical protein
VSRSRYRGRVLPLLRGLLRALPAAAVLASLAVVAAPAHAAVTGSTSAGDVVLFDKCETHDIDYALAISPGTSFWRLEVTVADPDGFSSEGTVLSSTKLSPTIGVVQVQFCGAEQPGTWTVHATGLFQLVPAVGIPFSLPDSTFQVRRAATHTRLVSHSAGHGQYRLTVNVKDERPKGFRPTASAQVKLERRVHGAWKQFGPRLQTTHGLATTLLAVPHGTKVRAVTASTGNFAGSESEPVRLA